MKNEKILVTFENRILAVKLLENALIDVNDLKEIYAFANENAQQRYYCVMFEAMNNYEVTEEAIEYMVNNPNNIAILAKAYIINNTKTERKVNMHLLFDKPELKPFTFSNSDEGMTYLKNILNQN